VIVEHWVLWVIAVVLLTTVTLQRLLFAPLSRVMVARQAAVTSARELAERAAAEARAASESLDAKTREARAEIYRQMEETRRAALARRQDLLADTRRQAEAAVQDASARVRADVTQARATLERDAHTLATTIVERVLGRPVS
jgi:F-type H+-transporting ATPase subunit b